VSTNKVFESEEDIMCSFQIQECTTFLRSRREKNKLNNWNRKKTRQEDRGKQTKIKT
jgi:hypothetical protein